ncbi:hypothetical protein [Algoriphagus sp. PAP.12]|uniref:hypothetical protein n=1 Tax=Algoriphagus sp. PAP.12 TaxID=2996678 RepID=UPI00227A5F6F|nr:hypothetical protein [Algoriphagus sp. PAP.12]
MNISEKYNNRIALGDRVNAFWQHWDNQYASSNFQDWNDEDGSFSKELYKSLKEVHPSLGCLSKLTQIGNRVEFLIFTTCTDVESIEALKELSRYKPELFEIQLIDLNNQIDDFQEFSLFYEAGSETEKIVQNFTANSEYTFIANAEDWQSETPVALSYSGNTKRWKTEIVI